MARAPKPSKFCQIAALLLLGLVSCQRPGEGGTAPNKETALSSRARTVITTDGEIDDVDSFIRLLLYANELQIEGLVYSSSMWHYKGDGAGTPFTSEMEMTRNIYGERTELRWPVRWSALRAFVAEDRFGRAFLSADGTRVDAETRSSAIHS